MSDTTRGKIAFSSGGKQYYLHFSINAFCAYQEATGSDIMSAFQEMEKGTTDFVLMRRVLWAGLQHMEITEHEAGALLGDLDLTEMLGLFSRAVKAAMPAPPDKGQTLDGGKPKAAAKAQNPKG